MNNPQSWVTRLFAFTCLLPPLAAQAAFPSVTGTVYLDTDSSGALSPGEAVQGVPVQLYVDNGDGVFDASLDSMVDSTFTSGDGVYAFAGLDVHTGYFIQQAEYDAGAIVIPASISGMLVPGSFNRLIDDFADQQVTDANPIYPIGQQNLTSPTVIGGQRDLHLQYLSGPAESTLRANPYGLNHVLEFSQSAGVISIATVTWDGIDADMSTTPSLAGLGGLGGLDLTADGSDAFGFQLGIDAAGAGEQLLIRIYTGPEVSTAVVDLAVTDGTAKVFQLVPFSTFVGEASFANVDAIQFQFGGTKPSIDAQIGPIGLVGPAIHNIAVGVPEPSSLCLGLVAIGWVAAHRRRRRHRVLPD